MSSQATVLKDGMIYTGGRFEGLDVRIDHGTIAELSPFISTSEKDVVIDVAGYAVVPGLINSHDHLEFNLFPRLGKPPYNNYVEWAEDVQRHYREKISRRIRIPLKYRLLWGGYKNLFSGVTTVFHHNDFHFIFRNGFPIRVFEKYIWIHSLRLDGDLHDKLRSRDGQLCAIHVAEGIDPDTASELRKLESLGGLSKRTVIIHGVGLSEGDLERIVAIGASFVWCPSSNLFLFGKTAPVEKLVPHVLVALGTDSTISGGPDLFHEIRIARELKLFSAQQILDMVTRIPARILGTNAGEIKVGKDADLLLYRPGNFADPLSSLFSLTSADIGCVLKTGSPVFEQMSFEKYFDVSGSQLSRVSFGGKPMLVTGDFPRLVSRIEKYLAAEDLPAGFPSVN